MRERCALLLQAVSESLKITCLTLQRAKLCAAGDTAEAENSPDG